VSSIPNECRPESDCLTGGQPSESQLAEVAEAGFRTVINLRGLGEPGTDVEPHILAKSGVKYIHIPISGPGEITREKAQLLSDALETAARPVMVHCASGNRVGALYALKAFHLDGHSIDDALEAGRRWGMTRMEPMVRQLLSQ
jgi:uncharacterized protein (TIGR01244 family)